MRQRSIFQPGPISSAVGLVLIGSVYPAHAQNLLLNPGYESPPSPASEDTVATGWTFTGDAKRVGGTFPINSGSKSIWFRTFNPIGGSVTQNVNIVGGGSYSLSGFLFFEPGYNSSDPGDGLVTQLGLTWLTGGGTPVGTPNFLNILPSDTPPTNSWTQFMFNAIAPATAAQVRVSFGWEGGGETPVQPQSAFLDDVALLGPGTPPGNDWGVNGSGDWNVSGNWSGGSVPNAIGASAGFLGVITSPQTVFTNTPVTVGQMTFNNGNTYVIAGAGSLTMQVSTGNAQINVQQGAQKINLPLRFNSDTNLTVAGGASLNLADPVTIAGSRTVTTSGNVAINAPLTIEPGGTLSFGSNGRLFGVPALGSGARIDVRTNSVAIDYNGPGSPLSAIRAQIISGYNGGAWNGQGIISSNANNSTHAVGYAEATAIFSSFPATFAGSSIDDTTILVRYTRYGDATLDGLVNLADFNRLAANFGSNNAVWSQGDFTYDGLVNLSDFNRLAANFGLSAGPDGPTPEDWAALASVIPEPMSGATLVLGGLLAATRRRRCAVA